MRWRRLPSVSRTATDPQDILKTHAWVVLTLNGKLLGEGLISDIRDHFPQPTLDRVASSPELMGAPLNFGMEDERAMKSGRLALAIHRSQEVLRRAAKSRATSDVTNVSPAHRSPLKGALPASASPTIFNFYFTVHNMTRATSNPSLRHSISLTLKELVPLGGLHRRSSNLTNSTSGVSGQETSGTKKSRKDSSQTSEPPTPTTAQPTPQARPRRPSHSLVSQQGRLFVAPIPQDGPQQTPPKLKRNITTESAPLVVEENIPKRPQPVPRQRAVTIQAPVVPSQPLPPFVVRKVSETDGLSFSTASYSGTTTTGTSTGGSCSAKRLSGARSVASPLSPRSGQSGDSAAAAGHSPQQSTGEGYTSKTVTPRQRSISTSTSSADMGSSKLSDAAYRALGYSRPGTNPLLVAGELARARKGSQTQADSTLPREPGEDRHALGAEEKTMPARGSQERKTSLDDSAIDTALRKVVASSPSPRQSSATEDLNQRRSAHSDLPWVIDNNDKHSSRTSNDGPTTEDSSWRDTMKRLDSSPPGDDDVPEAPISSAPSSSHQGSSAHPSPTSRFATLLTPVAEEIDKESMRGLSLGTAFANGTSTTSPVIERTPTLNQEQGVTKASSPVHPAMTEPSSQHNRAPSTEGSFSAPPDPPSLPERDSSLVSLRKKHSRFFSQSNSERTTDIRSSMAESELSASPTQALVRGTSSSNLWRQSLQGSSTALYALLEQLSSLRNQETRLLGTLHSRSGGFNALENELRAEVTRKQKIVEMLSELTGDDQTPLDDDHPEAVKKVAKRLSAAILADGVQHSSVAAGPTIEAISPTVSSFDTHQASVASENVTDGSAEVAQNQALVAPAATAGDVTPQLSDKAEPRGLFESTDQSIEPPTSGRATDTWSSGATTTTSRPASLKGHPQTDDLATGTHSSGPAWNDFAQDDELEELCDISGDTPADAEGKGLQLSRDEQTLPDALRLFSRSTADSEYKGAAFERPPDSSSRQDGSASRSMASRPSFDQLRTKDSSDGRMPLSPTLSSSSSGSVGTTATGATRRSRQQFINPFPAAEEAREGSSVKRGNQGPSDRIATKADGGTASSESVSSPASLHRHHQMRSRGGSQQSNAPSGFN